MLPVEVVPFCAESTCLRLQELAAVQVRCSACVCVCVEIFHRAFKNCFLQPLHDPHFTWNVLHQQLH
jgi:hypothetical protein